MTLESHARTSIGDADARPDSLTRTRCEAERPAAHASSGPSISVASDDEPSERGDEPTKLTPGSVIPDTRLEIVRWLGEGGMGTVFEVRHLDIDRHFAVKLLHRSESVARARRFRREAKTIGNIGSPWVVEIFDFKELPDGRLMYLMELVDGPTLLATQLATGPLELARLIALGRQICKGLEDAHTRGFVHRDIKPENIMLARDPDGRERVKIVDFGLAGLLANPSESSRSGTPTYMSPEQCKGEPADARADIYSLGVTLYELGCGRLPFVRNSVEALRRAHVGREPRPPSQVEGAPPLPERFDELVLRCMAKRPEQRFANAAEVEAALIELQIDQRLRTEWDDLPVPELPEARRRPLERGLAALRRDHERERKRRTLFGAVLAGVVVLSSGLGWYAGAQDRAAAVAAAEAELAELQRRIADASAERHWIYPSVERPHEASAYALLLQLEALDLDNADAVGAQLREAIAAELLAYADFYWDLPGGRPFAREFYAHALVFEPEQARAHERAGLSSSAAAALRQRAATGEFDEAELDTVAALAALAVPDERARLDALLDLYAEADELPASVGASLDRLIDELRRQLPDAAAAERQGAADAERSSAAAPSTPAPAPEPEPEPEAETEAGPAEASAGSDDDDDRAKAAELLAAADSAFAAGKRGEAERLYQRTLGLDPRSVAALIGLHRLHFDRGEYKDALAYAKRALALRPKRADLHLDVGDSCMKVLDYACAREHYQRADSLGSKPAKQRLQMLADRLGTAKGGESP